MNINIELFPIISKYNNNNYELSNIIININKKIILNYFI